MSCNVICFAEESPEEGFVHPTVVTDWGYFTTEVIKVTNGALTGGIDIGDGDNDGEPELVVGSWSNEVYLIEYDKEKLQWNSWIPYKDTEGLLATHIGDIDPGHKGTEILAGGFTGNLTIIEVDGKEVRNYTGFGFENNIWDIRTGDLIPGIPGNEIAVAHWTSFVSVLYKESGVWKRYNLSTRGKVTAVEIGEFDSSHDGLEMVSGSESGHIEEFYWDGIQFKNKLIYREDRAIRNVDIADYSSIYPGNELIAVSFSNNAGNATLISGSGYNWTSVDLYNSFRGLEALNVGDFNPEHPGPEAIFAGYANTATMVVDDGEKMISLDVWKGNLSHTSELTGVAVGDLYPQHKGSEVYVVGYDGSIKMLSYDYPGTGLDFGLNKNQLTIQRGASVGLDCSVWSQGGFKGPVDISLKIKNIDGTEITGPSDLITSLDKKSIDIKINEKHPLGLQIEAIMDADLDERILEIELISKTDPDIKNTYSLLVRVLNGTDFDLNVIPQKINASRHIGHNKAQFQIGVTSKTGKVLQPVKLQLSGLPIGWSYQFKPDTIDQYNQSLLTVEVPPEADLGIFPMSVIGSDGELTALADITLEVVDFIALLNISVFQVTSNKEGYLITTTIENKGSVALEDFKVQFLKDDRPERERSVDKLEPGRSLNISFTYENDRTEHSVSIYVIDIDPDVTVEGQGATIHYGEKVQEDPQIEVGTILTIILVLIVIMVIIAAILYFIFVRKQPEIEDDGDGEKRRPGERGRGR